MTPMVSGSCLEFRVSFLGNRPSGRTRRLVAALAALVLAGSACQSPAADEPEAQPDESVAARPSMEPEEATAPLELARQEIAAGDLNRALLLLDEARAAFDQDPGFWLLYGDTTLAFVEERIAQGESDIALIDGLYRDAASAFRRAGDLQPGSTEAGLGLARALRASGDFSGAFEAASRALEGSDPDREGGAWESADVGLLLEQGRAGLAMTIESVQAGQPVPAASRKAEAGLRAALDAGSSEAVVPLSDLYAWQGLQTDARDVLVAALGEDPESSEYLGRLKNLGQADPRGYANDLELVRSAVPGNATVLWYLGEARFLAHLQARQTRDFTLAYESLDRAEESFLASMSREPSFTDSSQTWLHLVRTARGWTLREEGRVDDAAQAFLAALDADPARLEAEAGPGTLRLGIDAIVADHFRSQDLAKVVSFLTRVTALHESSADWWNNLGFACRDRGVQLLQRGEAEAALALFEQSWSAYGRAVALAPSDARLVNDRALIAVYYLDEHHDLAEQELHRAIEVGQAQLDALPADVDPAVRQSLDEAVGDAWENLAYLDVIRRQRGDRAPRFLAESVQHFPFEDRLGVRRIQEALERLAAPQESPPSEGS